MRWIVQFYCDRRGRAPVERFIEGLPARMRAKVLRDIDLLAELGIDLGPPLVRSMGKGLWELRSRTGSDTTRILYFAASGRRFVLLHGFVKKTQKTPPDELATARQRLAEYLERERN